MSCRRKAVIEHFPQGHILGRPVLPHPRRTGICAPDLAQQVIVVPGCKPKFILNCGVLPAKEFVSHLSPSQPSVSSNLPISSCFFSCAPGLFRAVKKLYCYLTSTSSMRKFNSFPAISWFASKVIVFSSFAATATGTGRPY